MSMTSHDHHRDAIDEMHEDCCNTCGNLGYTIEINVEGVEYTENCFECFVAAHADAIKADTCSADDRGHQFEFGAHRCTHCGHVHPSLKEAA